MPTIHLGLNARPSCSNNPASVGDTTMNIGDVTCERCLWHAVTGQLASMQQHQSGLDVLLGRMHELMKARWGLGLEVPRG